MIYTLKLDKWASQASHLESLGSLSLFLTGCKLSFPWFSPPYWMSKLVLLNAWNNLFSNFVSYMLLDFSNLALPMLSLVIATMTTFLT